MEFKGMDMNNVWYSYDTQNCSSNKEGAIILAWKLSWVVINTNNISSTALSILALLTQVILVD